MNEFSTLKKFERCNVKLSIFILPFLFIIPINISAQHRKIEYNLETTVVGSTGKSSAFWAMSNKHGTISARPNSALLRTGLFLPFDSTRKNKLDYSLGIDVINRVDGKYEAILQQGYLKLKYRFLTLQGGRIEEYFGNQDPALSTGGLLWSGNAQPMPKISAGILDYTPIPFTWGLVEIKGAISHGWFEKDAYVKEEWLHHKYAYIRLGGKWPVNFYFGFHHYAQWGGVSPDVGRLPSSLRDYFVVFTAKQVAGDSSFIKPNPNIPGEISNRIGNHLGSRNIGLDIDTKPAKISFYFQSIFEDNSGKRWHNMPDGLWGVSVHLKSVSWLENIVYEYIDLTNQSMTWEQDRLANEPDNYFNHGYYLNGWTYKDYTLGSPLVTSPALLKLTEIPTDLHYDYLRNNKVRAHHFGFNGVIKKTNYKFLLTYSQNMGTYHVLFPETKKSVSSYLEIKRTLQQFYNIEISAALANDFGSMYKNNSSVLLTIRKRGKLLK